MNAKSTKMIMSVEKGLHTFLILCFNLIITDSKTSTLWKLNRDQTKIVEGDPFHAVVSYNGDQGEEDRIFNIITSTVLFGNSWIKHGVEYYCTDCQMLKSESDKLKNDTNDGEERLDCGKPVNFTFYDNLVGVSNRANHPNIADPQAVNLFTKKRSKNQEYDIENLEKKLKKSKKEKSKSVQLYNQLGNYWRLKGNPSNSIECFRKALAISPHNADVLLNLARMLFTLQYLDDAIYLTRRSLEVQPPDKGAWQQYFTLGEIFKAYGHYQEASLHLKHSLELKPNFEPAQLALKEMESMPAATIHIYTLVIIICLVLGVLLVILSSVDGSSDDCEIKPQRHFNKAMAMRSLKGLSMTQKHIRSKK